MCDANENCEKKMAARNVGGRGKGRNTSRPKRGHFFSVVPFRVIHDGPSKRGTTVSSSTCSTRRSLHPSPKFLVRNLKWTEKETYQSFSDAGTFTRLYKQRIHITVVVYSKNGAFTDEILDYVW